VPERVVHAKGGGAFGFLEVTNPEISGDKIEQAVRDR
jgi:catalase